ncbi:unnamed protein product [Pocillopora meandrina]|uniref:Integrase core domain-containing protein n=1 Tax=Pocillopora meandrina TaxID=46732 RepID=A0AAU9XU26_9CNID|nr:unnamed protein product [Pocillopora meandrina]
MNELSRDFDRIFEDSERSTNGLVGRPRLQILQQQLQTLHNDASSRWADIGRILGISERTLCHRRYEFGLPVKGLRIQRHRIQETIRRVDLVLRTLRAAQQIIRRVYSVPCPNALWHIDGNHKLIQPYKIIIHGGLDGFQE